MRRLAVVIAAAASLEQAGTDANCDAAGGAHYSAWYELVPAGAVRVPLTVRAGDTIAATVTVGGHRVRIALADRTTGARYTRTLTAAAVDVSSAEWIVEAPSAATLRERRRGRHGHARRAVGRGRRLRRQLRRGWGYLT